MRNLKRKFIDNFKSAFIFSLSLYLLYAVPQLNAAGAKAPTAAPPAAVLAEAKKYIASNEHEKALEMMKSFVEEHGGSETAAEVYIQIAKCEKEIYEKKRLVMVNNVIKAYEQIIEKYPYSDLGAEACFQIGQFYEKELKNNEEALKYYDKCVVEYPVTAYAASSLYRTGQINEAEGYYDMAIIAYERLSRDFSKYQIAVESLLRIKDIYATKMEPGSKTLDKSLEAYHDVINNYPQNKKTPEILMELAKFYKDKKGDAHNAIKTYQQVIERFPQDKNAYEAYMSIAKIHEENKDYKSVADTYNKIYEAFSDHQNADKMLFDIAMIYETNLREYKKKRIEGKTYFKLEKNNLNEAVKYYTRLVDTFPQSKYAPAALMKIGNILNTDMANGLEARFMYKAVVDKYPDSKEYAGALELYNKMR